MRALVVCALLATSASAAADRAAPEPGTREWHTLERAIDRYCRAHRDNDNCPDMVATMRSPSRASLTWRDDVLEVLDVAHPGRDDAAAIARVRRGRHGWIVVEVASTYAPL